MFDADHAPLGPDVARILQNNPYTFVATGPQTFVPQKRPVQDEGARKVPASVTAAHMTRDEAAAPDVPAPFSTWKLTNDRSPDSILQQMGAHVQEVQRCVDMVQSVLITNAAMRRIVSSAHMQRFDERLCVFFRWVLQAYTAMMVAPPQDLVSYLDPSNALHTPRRAMAHLHAMSLLRCCLVRPVRPVELQVLLCRVRSFDQELVGAPQLEVREWHNKYICDARMRHTGLRSANERRQRDAMLGHITRFEPVSTEASSNTSINVFADALGRILGVSISTSTTQPMLTASDFYPVQFRFLPPHAQLQNTGEGEDANSDDDMQMVETESSMSVPLVCPLSCMPMRMPARFRACKHLQCFDLNSFRDMCLQAKRMRPSAASPLKCPICKTPNDSLEKLGVDRWMLGILTKIRARYDMGDSVDDALDFTDSDEEQEEPESASDKRAWTEHMRVVHRGRAWTVVTDSVPARKADAPAEEVLE